MAKKIYTKIDAAGNVVEIPVKAADSEKLDGKSSSEYAPSSHSHVASDINSGVIAPARLGTGTPSTSTFLRGDGAWATPPSGGGGGSSFITGTCSTAIGTAAKIVTLTDSSYTPVAGDMFLITFTNGNSAASPTLNINSKGAKNIRLGNTNASTVTFSVGAGSVVVLIFDGTYFNLTGSYRTTDVGGAPTRTLLGSRTNTDGTITVSNIHNYDEIEIMVYSQGGAGTSADPTKVLRNISRGVHTLFAYTQDTNMGMYTREGLDVVGALYNASAAFHVEVTQNNSAGTQLNVNYTGTVTGVTTYVYGIKY